VWISHRSPTQPGQGKFLLIQFTGCFFVIKGYTILSIAFSATNWDGHVIFSFIQLIWHFALIGFWTPIWLFWTPVWILVKWPFSFYQYWVFWGFIHKRCWSTFWLWFCQYFLSCWASAEMLGPSSMPSLLTQKVKIVNLPSRPLLYLHSGSEGEIAWVSCMLNLDLKKIILF
jgi:hypothetical protein